jgi:hypothetical protein
MTRRDYVILAGALRRAYPGEDVPRIAHKTWRTAVVEVSKALAADNRNFKYDTFFSAVTKDLL